MFKAIKDKKIKAINNSGDFPCLNYDIIEEDTEHNVEDYTQYDGEFLLLEIPVPPEEEQREKRANAYALEVDPITAHIQRLRDEEQTEEVIAEIADLIAERALKVEEIKQRYPYPEEQNVESSSNIHLQNID